MEQPVVGDQVDAFAQFRRGGIARFGDPQDLRQLAARPRDVVVAIALLQRHQAVVAQLRDARAAHAGDAFARIGDGALLVEIDGFLEQERQIGCRHDCQ